MSDSPDLSALLGNLAGREQLPDSAVRQLADIAVLMRRPAGSILQVEGEAALAIYIVCSGALKVYRSGPNGREQVLTVAKASDPVNLVPVFDGDACPASVEALTDATLFAFPIQPLKELLAREPLLAVAMLRQLAARQRHLVALIDDLALHTVQARLARLLLSEDEAVARGQPPSNLTQSDMAGQIGTVREMVSRTLRTLEALGIIRADKRRIVVLDRAALAACVEE